LSDEEQGWEEPRRTARARQHGERVAIFEHLLHTSGRGDRIPCSLRVAEYMVDKFAIIMDEMSWHHKKPWGDRETLYESITKYPPTTDSAACLKKVLMRTRQRHQSDLRDVSHPLWSKGCALWNRIAFQRLRFQKERRWYAVVRTADLQRRMLVLHVSTGWGMRAQKNEQSERQCTHRDTTLADLFAPEIRVTPALQDKLDKPQLKDILCEGFRPHFIKGPKTRQGRNYGNVLHHYRHECHLLPRNLTNCA
jgi:hypothetical protein